MFWFDWNCAGPVTVPPVRGNLVLSATVMLAEPLNETPLIVRAVWSVVAVAALPVVDADEPLMLMPQVPEAPDPVRDGA